MAGAAANPRSRGRRPAVSRQGKAAESDDLSKRPLIAGGDFWGAVIAVAVAAAGWRDPAIWPVNRQVRPMAGAKAPSGGEEETSPPRAFSFAGVCPGSGHPVPVLMSGGARLP